MTKTQTSWLTVLLWLIAMFYNLFTQKFQYEFHLEHNGRTHSYQCVALFANSSSVMSTCSWCQFQTPASRRSKYLDPPFRPSFHWGQLLARHSLAAFWRIGCLWDTGRRHLVGNMLTLVCTPVVLTFGWPWPVLLSPGWHAASISARVPRVFNIVMMSSTMCVWACLQSTSNPRKVMYSECNCVSVNVSKRLRCTLSAGPVSPSCTSATSAPFPWPSCGFAVYILISLSVRKWWSRKMSLRTAVSFVFIRFGFAQSPTQGREPRLYTCNVLRASAVL